VGVSELIHLPVRRLGASSADGTPRRGHGPGQDSHRQIALVVGAAAFADTIAAVLSDTDLEGLWRRDETEAAAAMAERRPALVLMEAPAWSVPTAAFCRKIALSGVAPVIVLLGGGEGRERALALEAGAEDCVSLSCPPLELAARVRRTLRREPTDGPVEFGEWRLDAMRREVIAADGRRLPIGQGQLAILQCLLLDRGRVTSIGELAIAARGGSGTPLTDNNLRVAVFRLRSKLGRDSGGRRAIDCVRHRGYALSRAAQSLGGHDDARPDHVPPPATATHRL
jgi:DNA-binding response OmpR family regulator